METMDFGGLQHPVQISSLKMGTEIPKIKKIIPVLFCIMKIICHQSSGALWVDPELLGEVWEPPSLTLKLNQSSPHGRGRCLRQHEEAQPSSSAVGRKITGEIAKRMN